MQDTRKTVGFIQDFVPEREGVQSPNYGWPKKCPKCTGSPVQDEVLLRTSLKRSRKKRSFHGWFFDTQNTFHLMVRGLKTAFFMSFTPILYRCPTILWQEEELGILVVGWKWLFFLCEIRFRTRTRKGDRKMVLGGGVNPYGSSILRVPCLIFICVPWQS